MPAKIDQKVEAWKNKLLDLGKRNRLINYRETKRSTLSIINPDIFALWTGFVENGNSLEFPYYSEYNQENGESDNVDTLPSDIVTNQTLKEMQFTLRNLRNKAKMAIEEQGINILYLAFGFLKWRESETSIEQLVSPLVLVPVTLTVESISSPFILQMTDDEIVVNPALKYKLENEYGLTFPEFDEELGLQKFLDSIQVAVKRNSGWSVQQEVALSLFSFLKINMYSDLEHNKQEIVSNPIVRAISGDSSALQHIPEDLNDFDFDKKLKPVNMFQVVDADSSQQEAILYAKNGISFVLQGPPGTGKSQTITNIISECLADGKKVLFVSEKKAALDVVYNRLTSAGLDDFCLVLHSHKTNKRAVLDQLQSALNLARNKAQLSDEAYHKLDALYRDTKKLNQYADQLYTKILPLGQTIYHANGVLAELEDYADVIFGIPDIRNTTTEQYSQYLYVLDAFKNTLGKMSEDFDSNPWRGSGVPAVTNELRHDINARFPELANKLAQCSEKTQDMFESVCLDRTLCYQSLEEARSLFSTAMNSPCIPYDWISKIDLLSLPDEIPEYEKITTKFAQETAHLQEQYAIINDHGVCTVHLPTVAELNSSESILSQQNNLLHLVETDATLSRIAQVKDFASFQNEVENVKSHITDIIHIKERLSQYYTPGVYDVDFEALLLKYGSSYSSFTNEILTHVSLDEESVSVPFGLLPESWLQDNLTELIEDCLTYSSHKNAFSEKARHLKEIPSSLLDRLGLSFVNIESAVNLQKLSDIQTHLHNHIVSNSPMAVMSVKNTADFCKKEISIAKSKSSKIQELQNELLQEFDREVLDLEYEDMLTRYKLEYTSFFKFFKGSYRADQRQIKLLHKNIAEKLDDSKIVSVLTKLKEISQTRSEINCECAHLIDAFGDEFRYENTNFEEIEVVCDTCICLQKASTLVEEMYKIASIFTPDNTDLSHKYGVWYKGLNTSWESILQALQWTLDFRKQLRCDATVLAPYYKSNDVRLDEYAFFTTLTTLQNIQLKRSQCKTLFSQFISVMGDTFSFEDTDFGKVDAYLSTYNAIMRSQTILALLADTMALLTEKEDTLAAHYDFLYSRMTTPWSNIRQALSWACEFKKCVLQYSPNEEFVKKVCSDSHAIEKCKAYAEQISAMLQDIEPDFNWFLSLFQDSILYKSMDLRLLSHRIQRCVNGLFLLEEWIDFINARNDCTKAGLNEYVQQIEQQRIKPCDIIPVFEKRFFRLWLDAVLPEYPAVLNFRRLKQENTIREFSQLDKMQFEIAKARIKGKLINELPLLDKFTSGMDEMGILKRELSKQRKIMPIRKLFRQIPNLLLVLKPCLMMSPLSVSLFLEADAYKFDTVIFDEASQVCTENAIGAIARGKQVIIAGDSKQLPPTNFFSTSISDTDTYDMDDEDDDTSAYESILDEANLLPERTLLWHYRSRHEHLIAFSNAKIYHNSLITFPSNVDRIPDNGVEYIYVRDGFYDRGGRKGNVPEANRVAELVFEHFKKYPNRSLGVIAFGEVQQQAIEAALRQMRMRNQQCERFFAEDREEAFFVKNLENVQGDERDTIIFSIGYAKDAQGVFRMNFGPLSKNGGERRLNVAVTRAKYNVKLVGSILPTDIDTDRVSAEGPKLLRSYIEFAINGITSLQREITENDIVQHDSPFEKAVYDFLDRKGYKLATQVGCSGYRIDMAVKHPTLSGRYILGIECDGASYHSAKTARERDRLRQDVLEQMGWRIYRIWSTDWIKDPVTEGSRLIEAIENALKNYGNDVSLSIPAKTSPENFVAFEEKELSIEEMNNPYGFKDEQHLSFIGSTLGSKRCPSLQFCIIEIVSASYPIHYELLCQQIAPLLGNAKATVKVKREVDEQLARLGNKIVRKGDFLFPAKYKMISPRVNSRKINYISTEELAEAMYVVLSKSVGLTKDLLCAETARAYNFHRMTQNITSAVNSAFDLLISQDRIKLVEDKPIISK